MTKKQLRDFFERMYLKIPQIARPQFECRSMRNLFEQMAVLEFKLQQPMTVEEICDLLDSRLYLTQMYSLIPCADYPEKVAVCYFCSSGSDVMFQVNFSSTDSGKVYSVGIKLFESLELMVASLRDELRRMKSRPCSFNYQISELELFEFCS